jgi:hypothetical protein
MSKAFLAHCRCDNHYVCTCTSPDGNKVAVDFNLTSQKEHPQMTLDQISAALDKLSFAERAKVLNKYSKIADMSAAAESLRMKRLQAAATDPAYAVAIKNAVRGLDALGLKLETVAASGDTAALDAAMDKNNWDSGRRMQLKTFSQTSAGFANHKVFFAAFFFFVHGEDRRGVSHFDFLRDNGRPARNRPQTNRATPGKV